MKRKTRVLVVDDSAIARELIERGLSLDPDIEVVGKASDAFSARDNVPWSVITSVFSLRITATDSGAWPVRLCSNALAAWAICCATLGSSFFIGLPPALIVNVLRRQEQQMPTWRCTRR